MLDECNEIAKILERISDRAKTEAANGYNDSAKLLELLCKDLLTAICNLEFDPLNLVKSNQEIYDLITKDKKNMFQITINGNFAKKCKGTINKFKASKYYQTSHLYIIFFIKITQKTRQYEEDGKVTIFDFDDIIRLIYHIKDLGVLNHVLNIVKQYSGEAKCGYKPKRIPCREDYLLRDVSSDEGRCGLLELVREGRKIMLLGDAGIGKSEELIHTYNECLKEGWTPFLYRLKNYCGEEIKNLLPECFEGAKNPIVFFDAYDEIEVKYAEDFIKKVNSYSGTNNKVIYVCSSRTNFYNEKSNIRLDDALVVELMPLKKEDVSNALEKQGMSNLMEKLELLRLDNPFNLQEAIKANIGASTSIYEVMKRALDIAFNDYIRKYAIDKKEEQLGVLEEIAIRLVESGENSFHDPDTSLKGFSWVDVNEEGELEFKHNNYKEFLAANYFTKVPLEELKHKCSININDQVFVKSRYSNVIGYLCVYYGGTNEELSEFLMESGRSILIRYGEVPINKKAPIIRNMFNETNKKRCWLRKSEYYSDGTLASFCNNLVTVKELASFVNEKYYRTTVISAINILMKVDRTNLKFEMPTLKQTLKRLKNDPQVYNDATYLVAVINLYDVLCEDVEVSKQLVKEYICDKVSSVRAAAMAILNKRELLKYFIKEVVDLIKNKDARATFSRSDGEIFDIGESFYCSQAIKNTKDESIIMSLISELLDRRIDEIASYNDAISAMEAIVNPTERFKQFICSCYIEFKKLYFYECIASVEKLIVKYDLFEQCYNKIVEQRIDGSQKLDMIWEIYQDKYFRLMFNFLKEQNDDELFVITLKLLYNAGKSRSALSKRIKELGYVCEKGVSYKDKTSMQRQKEFDSLFSESEIKRNLLRMFDLLGKDEMCYGDWDGIDYLQRQNLFGYVENFYKGIDKITRNKVSSLHISTEYQINKICQFLDKMSNIKVSVKQERFLMKWLKCNMDKVDFKKAVYYNEDGSGWEINEYAYIAFIIISYLDLSCDNEMIRDMVCYEYKMTEDQSLVLTFVESKIGIDETCKAIMDCIENGKLKGFLLYSRLKYLLNNHCKQARNSIIRLLSTINNVCEMCYYEIVQGIIEYKMVEEASCHYDSYPSKFKDIFIQKLIESQYADIAIELREPEIQGGNEQSFYYAKQLVAAGSPVALQFYYDWAENNIEKQKLNESNVPQFESIKKFECADLLIKLLRLTYRLPKGFDLMRSRILKALVTIGGQSLNNANYICKRLEPIAADTSIDKSGYLYHTIDEIIQILIEKIEHD